jgi:outer membrane lipoprotein-sorting protein
MSIVSRHPTIRWIIPAAVAAIAIGGTTLATRLAASAAANLPPRSAAQLLVDIQTARLVAASGTVVEKADLGLPQLPTIGGSGSSDLTSLISGNHTLRVWYDGPSKARVALMGTLGESDVIRNGSDLWTWSSDGNTATHRVLPADGTDRAAPSLDDLGGLSRSGLTPQQAADQALAAIDPTTTVSTDGSARVAGRDVYELVLSPKDHSSLVGQVRVAVDAVRHVPLRVQVFAKNAASPSIQIGFTQISFTRPASSEFRFTPPPGVKVTQESPPATSPEAKGTKPDPAQPKSARPEHGKPEKAKPGDSAEPTLTGKGWTAVLEAKLPADDSAQLPGKAAGGERTKGSAAGELMRVLGALPRVSGSWGSGRLLHSSLFSVLLTDDGRVLVGAVSPARLYQVAAAVPAAGATK